MIYGERIRLRAPGREDLPRFVAWLNDPEVRQGLSLYLPLSEDQEDAWYENMMKSPNELHPMVIEVRQGEAWAPIGNCGFHSVNWQVRSGELGIFIGEKALWNQGYGSEVMRLLLKHGFNTLNLNRVSLRVHSNNPRAIRAYEKAGFKHEGREREAVYMDGHYCDLLFMSVLRSEWEG